MKRLLVAVVFNAPMLFAPPAVGHTDTVQCHCSPGGAVWCEDLDTGASWQATDYNSPQCP